MGSDTVNWPPDFSDFKRLDTILKCGICYEYMTNCMITSCSHNYCSLCIRKFMQYKNQCPTCFENIFEINLRNNRPLDEVILIYIKLRDKLLRALRIASVPVAKKESDLTVSPVTPKVESPQLQQKSASKPNKSETKAKDLFNKATEDDVILNGVKIPGIFNAPRVLVKPKKPGELTLCPVCQVDVPTKNINMHLDSCLAVDSEAQHKKKVQPKRDPLPKRLYYLMQDKTLKKTLKEYGLNIHGDRKTLIARIQRYTVIYNAENDAPNPRSVTELIQQLEREEREEHKPNSIMKVIQSKISVDRKADPATIDNANKAYCEENKESFKKLIEAMRAREGRNIRPLKPASRIYSDDEDDPNSIPPDSSEPNDFNENNDITINNEFDPNEPSTSKCLDNQSNVEKVHKPSSIYSQATIYGSDSDSDNDIFENKMENNGEITVHNIDWDRTKVEDESESEMIKEETNIDADTNLDASSCTLAPEDESYKEDEEEVDSDDSSINSIFNSSKISNGSFTPTSRMTRSKAKGSVTIDSPSVLKGRKRPLEEKSPGEAPNMEEVFNKFFEDNSGAQVCDEQDNLGSDKDSALISNLLEGAHTTNFTTPKNSRKSANSSGKRIARTAAKPKSRKRFKCDLSPEF